MLKTKFILLLALVFQLNEVEAIKQYSLKIIDGISGSEKIVLNKGIFTKISLVLTSETEEEFSYEKDENKKPSYKLAFNDENIVALEKEMILTPQDSLVYTNYIGISCASEIKGQYSFSINVEKANDYTDDDSLDHKSNIDVEISNIVTEINLDLLFNSIAQKSKNFFKIENELYNVDEIKVSINDVQSLLADFELNAISIASFADRKEEISKDTPSNHGILFNYPFFPTKELAAAKLKFKLDLDAKLAGVCFDLKKTDFEFELKIDNVIGLDTNVKTAIIYNTENATPKYDISNKIKISTVIPIAPVILECRFELNSTALIDGEALYETAEKSNVFKTVVTSTGKFDINMENLNANSEYYVKCDISNTEDLLEKIYVTIGNFKGSDIIKELMPSKDPNAIPQCAKFTFEDNIQATAFFGLGPLYCKYFMKKNDALLSRALPSIICDSTKLGDKEATLCVAPSPFYNMAKYISKKETDFNDRFNEFVNQVQNLDFSKYGYEFVKINVTKVEREYDIAINPSSISVSYSKTNLALIPTYEFKVKSTHSQQIQCYYNKLLSPQESKFLKIFENKITLKPGEETTITVGGALVPYMMNTLNFKCYNLPDFIYRYETTGTMTKYSYYYEGLVPDLIGDIISDTTINCNEKKNLINPRCLKENLVSVVDLMKTEIPEKIKKIEETVEQYAATAKKIKEDFLNNLLKDFTNIMNKSERTVKEIVEKIAEILKYLSYTDCSIYANGETNEENQTIKGEIYVQCRLKKQEIIEKIYNLIKDKLQCANFLPFITTNKISENLEENVKYILLLVNELSNNPESFKDKTSEFLIQLVDCLIDNFDNYWKEVEAYLKTTGKYLDESIKAIKRDLEIIILQTLENLAKVIDFDQIDGYIDKITKTGLIVYDKAKEIQKKILEFSKRLIDYGSANYTFSGSMIANIETKEGISASAETESKATFIQDKDIVILTHSNFLLNSKGVSALQTLVFESPIVSVKAAAGAEGNSEAVNTFVSITLYDSTGKEISINDIKEAFRPQILYLKEKYNNLKACYYYDESKNDLVTNGISVVEKVEYLGKEYFKCVSSHLSSFTAGTYVSNNNKNNGNNTVMIVLIIVGIIALLIIAIFVYIMIRRKSSNGIDVNKEFEKKEGLVSV